MPNNELKKLYRNILKERKMNKNRLKDYLYMKGTVYVPQKNKRRQLKDAEELLKCDIIIITNYIQKCLKKI